MSSCGRRSGCPTRRSGATTPRSLPWCHSAATSPTRSSSRLLGCSACVVITSAMAGYAFARLRFPVREAIFFLYLGTMMIPGQVTMIPNFIIMRFCTGSIPTRRSSSPNSSAPSAHS